MKKKVFSLVLVLCMLVSMIPNAAFADDLEWGEVRVYSYYSDIGFVWGYAGADPVGVPETEIAEEKDGYTFQGWYRVTALDESGIATAYGELLCATPTYNYTMEKYLAMVAVYERTTMSPNALKLTAHYQDRNGNTIREDGDVQFGDYTVECQDIAPTIDGHKYLYEQIAGGASGYTFYHVKKDAADSPWNPSYYGITGDGQSVILTEPVEIIYYYYVPNSPAGYPTAYYQAEDGKELHASETLSLDEDGGIWLTEPVGEYDSYKVLAPSIDGYTIKEIRVADGQGFTNLADTEHGLHLKGWDDYYGEWVFHSSEGEVTAAHGTPTFTYVYTSNAQTSGFTIDETNFPDSEFRRYVSEHFDSDGSGTLSESEIAVASVIDFGGHGDNPWVKEYNISSLAGIEYFTALVELNCSYSNVSSLSLNNNQNLRILNCAQCHDLSSLDLSGNTQLEELICWYDFGLNTLDLSHNPMLRVLECDGNGMSSLDISHNPVLAALSCGQNSFTSLDFNGSSSLRTLNCTDCASLVSLNLSNCTALNTVECENCALTSLNINGCLSLEKLFCENNQLTSLSTQGCANLIWLDCSDNTLTTLDVSGAPLLKILDCESNPLSGLDVRQNTALEVLLVDGCGLATLDLSQNAALVRLNVIDNALSSLDISGNLSLKVLECAMSPLTTLDISANATLKSVYAAGVTDQAGDMANFYLGAPTGTDDMLGAMPTQNHRDNIYYTTGPAGGAYYAEGLWISPSVEVIAESQTPHEHSWDDGVATTAATCIESGVKTYTCSDCGETKTETIPATGHDYVWTVTRTPTCTEEGVEMQICSRDASHVGAIREIARLEHAWDEGVVQKEVGDNEAGIMLYICTNCGETKTEYILPEILTGTFGDGFSWTLENETLTISGKGEMPNWASITSGGSHSISYTPWYVYRDSIKSVVIEKGITTIGGGAFYYCRAMVSISIPEGIKGIGVDAFDGCGSLTSVTIPSSVTYISNGAFKDCYDLRDIYITDMNAWCNISFSYNPPQGRAQNLYLNGELITDLHIPDGVTRIRQFAFLNSIFTSVTIPQSVNTVEWNAFADCARVTDVYYAGSEDDWAKIDFRNGNEDLTSAIIHYNSTGPESDGKSGICGENLTWRLDDGGVLTISGIGRMYDYSDTVDSGAPWFPVKDQIKKVVLGEGVLSIGDYAFDRCEKLAHIAVPVKTISVGRGAFNRCVSLTSVTFPTNGFEGVSEIGIGAFSECSNLTNITLPDTLTTVWDSAFFGCTALADIYYMGYEKDWISVIIQPGNECLTGAELHCKQPKDTSLDNLLRGFSTSYDRDLALIAAELSLATYTGNADSDVRQYLYDRGFSDKNIYSNNYGGSLAFTVATKEWEDNTGWGDVSDVLVVVAQGSTSGYEFLQDAVTGWGQEFYGYEAYDVVRDFYKDIFDGINQLIQPGKTYRVLVTGHSLGGAAANLVAAKLTTDYYGCSNVFCYTFGAIDSIVSDGTVAHGYENIHNITNYHDSFGPNGRPMFTARGNSRYGKFGHIDLFFLDLDQGAAFAINNHGMAEAYLPAVRDGLVRHNLAQDQKIVSWHCPIDVEIFKDEKLVGRVTNDIVDNAVTTIPIMVIDGAKYAYLDDATAYRFEITATDYGTMQYKVVEAATGSQIKSFSDIQLEPGKEMYSEVGGQIADSDIGLYVLGNDDTPIREVHEDGTETAITHIHEWDGGVITTAPTCTENGVRTYTCTICGETKAEDVPSIDHSWDAGTVTKAATCTEAGVMTYTCTACGINGTTEIPALGHNYEGGVCKTCGGAQPGFAPKIIEGSGGTAHYGSDYSFRSDAAFNTFLAVYVDGAELSATNYTAKEGSTIITLKGSYIKTLAAGTHTIRIASTLGNADGTFKVSESPKTGDTSDLFKWSFLAVDSFVCLGCLWGLYLLASKKRRAYDPRH